MLGVGIQVVVVGIQDVVVVGIDIVFLEVLVDHAVLLELFLLPFDVACKDRKRQFYSLFIYFSHYLVI